MAQQTDTPGWTVSALRGAVLAGALLAVFSAFGVGDDENGGDALLLPLVLVVITGAVGGALYHFLTSCEIPRWWHPVAGFLIYAALVSLAFILGMGLK